MEQVTLVLVPANGDGQATSAMPFCRCTAATDDRIQDTEIEDQVELFMKRQAELESGGTLYA